MLNLLINKIFSSVIQIIVFSLIPFVWWLITARKKISFLQWIGIKGIPSDNKKKVLVKTSIVSILFMIIGAALLMMLSGTETATSEFTGKCAAAIPAILVYAAFNTALPEEIVFRGFLLKRIESKFGFIAANVIQATLFGLMHGVMFVSVLGVFRAVLVIAFTGVIAFFMGWINEKDANGSIIPSWIIHTASNIFSGVAAAFGWF